MFNLSNPVKDKGDYDQLVEFVTTRSVGDYFGRSFYKDIKNSALGCALRTMRLDALTLMYRPIDPLRSEFYYLRSEQIIDKWVAKDHISKDPNGEYVCSTRNIIRKYSFDELKAALEEKKQMTEEAQKKFREVGLEVNEINESGEPLKLACTKGICLGMVLDLAKQMLIDEKSIEELIPTISKGGRLEAEILQVAIEASSWKYSNTHLEHLDFLMQVISDNSASLPELFREIRREGIISLIVEVDSRLNDEPAPAEPIRKFTDGIDVENDLKEGLFSLNSNENYKGIKAWNKEKEVLKLIIFNIINDIRSSNFVEKEDIDNSIIDNEVLQKALITEINRIYEQQKLKANSNQLKIFHSRRAQLIGEVQIALAFNIIKGVTDVLPNNFASRIVKAARERLPKKRSDLLVGTDLCKLKYEQMDSVMGIREFCADDETYLKRIEILESGFYCVDLKRIGSKVSHVIALIKDVNGSGYLFDPRFGLKKFNNIKEAQIFLRKTVIDYGNEKGFLNIPEWLCVDVEVFKILRR